MSPFPLIVPCQYTEHGDIWPAEEDAFGGGGATRLVPEWYYSHMTTTSGDAPSKLVEPELPLSHYVDTITVLTGLHTPSAELELVEWCKKADLVFVESVSATPEERRDLMSWLVFLARGDIVTDAHKEEVARVIAGVDEEMGGSAFNILRIAYLAREAKPLIVPVDDTVGGDVETAASRVHIRTLITLLAGMTEADIRDPASATKSLNDKFAELRKEVQARDRIVARQVRSVVWSNVAGGRPSKRIVVIQGESHRSVPALRNYFPDVTISEESYNAVAHTTPLQQNFTIRTLQAHAVPTEEKAVDQETVLRLYIGLHMLSRLFDENSTAFEADPEAPATVDELQDIALRLLEANPAVFEV